MTSLHQRRHPRFAPAFALLAGLSALPTSAADSDFRVIGGLSLQEKSHSFNVALPVTSRQTTYNLAIGGTARGIYALVEFEKPFSQYTTIFPHVTSPYVVNVTREDNTLTIGYNLWRT